MKIVERSKRESQFKFIVLKPLVWESGKLVEVGEQIIVKEQADQDGLVRLGKIRPADLPEIGTYVALRAFTLPGKKEKFTAKKLDLVELRGEDALPLMFARACLPQNPDQWRPYQMRLGGPKKNLVWEKILDETDTRLAVKKKCKDLGVEYPSTEK